MAHLEVKPRKPYPMWIWALLLIFIIIAIIVIFNIYVDGDVPTVTSHFIAQKTINV
jgi:hypothetical protein